MSEPIDESKLLLKERDKLLVHVNKLLADSHQSLKHSDKLSRESSKNIVESKKLLLKSDESPPTPQSNENSQLT